MNIKNKKLNNVIIFVIFFILLMNVQSVWYFGPDGGVYLGTAKNLVNQCKYYFNGHPNLLYYPGMSLLLSPFFYFFDDPYVFINILLMTIVLLSVWFCKNYFEYNRYGFVGIIIPYALLCAGIMQQQMFFVKSDGLFLLLSIICLYMWNKYKTNNIDKYLFVVALIVAYATLVRFQGLFLIFALLFALFLHFFYKKKFYFQNLCIYACVFVITLLPFCVWTIRNYVLHTEHTFNMANAFFFGLKGLRLYAPGAHEASWIENDALYGLYSLLFFIKGLANQIIHVDILNVLPFVHEICFILFILFVILGFKKWFNKGSTFEVTYVVISLSYILWTNMTSKGLYTVSRYWLPMLPFMYCILFFGFCRAVSIINNKKVRYVVSFLAVMLIFHNGIAHYVHFLSNDTSERYEISYARLIEMKHFLKNNHNVNSETVFASTDWGVIPYVLGYQTYQVLNDKNSQYTFERMLKYKTKYLIVLDGLAAFPEYGRNMVDSNQEIFNRIKHDRIGTTDKYLSLYKINLQGIKKRIH